MKGKVSEKLRSILNNPDASTQLRNALARGKRGQVRDGKKIYVVKSVSATRTGADVIVKAGTPTRSANNIIVPA